MRNTFYHYSLKIMCGIIGYINKYSELDLKVGLDKMEHRGPDSSKFGNYQNREVYFGLGHRRLAIIDLDSSSNQPLSSDDGRYHLVFNGEIYNYKKLKSKLKLLGVSFKTKGDTEVLLNWLIHTGCDRLNEISGMFAVAFYDHQEGSLLLIRDQLGIKPLYYSNKGDSMVFSSELRGIFSFPHVKREIDEGLIPEYLLSGFIHEPETGFKNVQKVAPGSYQKWSFKSSMVQEEFKYWSGIEKNKKPVQNDIEKAIVKSIEEHTVSDVPVGLFFSGGIDSSLILASLKNDITSLTVESHEEEYSEAGVTSDLKYAKLVAGELHKQVHTISLGNHINSADDFLQAIEQVAEGNEELMYDFTYISSLHLSKEARKKGLIVMLSGMGADELFGGYPRYQLVRFKNIYKFLSPFVNIFLTKVPWFSKKINRFNTFLKESNFGMAYVSLVGVFSKFEIMQNWHREDDIIRFENKLNRILDPVANESDLKKGMYLDRFGFLPHNFMVADKSSMRASIEMRVPLATKDLAEKAWNQKDSQILSIKRRKLGLRTMLLRFISKKIVDRRKAGFNPPLDGYVKSVGADRLISMLCDERFSNKLNPTFIRNLINEHFLGSKNHTYRIYQLLHLRAWLKLNS